MIKKRRNLIIISSTIFFALVIMLIVFVVLNISSKNQDYIIINTNFIKTEVDNGNSIIVLYGQELCGSCNTMKSKVKEAISGKNITLYYLDADENTDFDFLKIYKIKMVPSLFIIKNNALSVYEGDLPSEQILDIIGDFL